MDFVAIDFETANSNRASACQIALAKVVNSEIVDVWESYISPVEPFQELGPINYGKHKISQETYLSAPTMAELWPQIKEFIGDLILVAHNASFDIDVLNKSLESCGVNDEIPRSACSQILASGLLSNQKVSLKILTEQFGIALTNHHDAKYDAIACAELTLALSEKAGISDVESLLKRAKYSKGSGGFATAQNHRSRELRAANENRAEELITFFKNGPSNVDFVDLPFSEMKISVIRSVFKLDDSEIETWVNALGGTFLKPEQEEWGDLTLEGNYSRSSSAEKVRDLKQLAVLKSKKANLLSAEKFLEIIQAAMAEK